jgi:hypothetical protein
LSRNGLKKNLYPNDFDHERAKNGKTRIHPYIVFSRGATISMNAKSANFFALWHRVMVESAGMGT